jgi:hypothetical protein
LILIASPVAVLSWILAPYVAILDETGNKEEALTYWLTVPPVDFRIGYVLSPTRVAYVEPSVEVYKERSTYAADPVSVAIKNPMVIECISLAETKRSLSVVRSIKGLVLPVRVIGSWVTLTFVSKGRTTPASVILR